MQDKNFNKAAKMGQTAFLLGMGGCSLFVLASVVVVGAFIVLVAL